MRHAILIASVLLLSTSVIMIKGGAVHPYVLAAWRMVMAVGLLYPLFARARRQHPQFPLAEAWRRAWLPGVLLGLHFLSWNLGTRLTSPAHSGLALTILPLVTPFVLRAVAGDRVTRGEWIGTGFAFLGVAVMVGSDFRVDRQHAWGDLICIGSIWLCALYVAIGRRNRDFPSVWLYLLPLNVCTALTCLLVAVFHADFWRLHPVREYGLAFALAFVCSLLGHSLLNISLRLFRGQTVSLVTQSQSVFTAFWGWLVFDAVPAAPFYIAATLMLAGVGVAVCLGQNAIPSSDEVDPGALSPRRERGPWK
jgi:drug/metabolite transporter (DMT)-like permease